MQQMEHREGFQEYYNYGGAKAEKEKEEVRWREDEVERTYFVVNGVVYWSRADALDACQS